MSAVEEAVQPRGGRREAASRARMWRTAALLAVLCWGAWRPSPVAAQATIDPAEGARFRYGPIALLPAVVFSTGHDSNVYREPIGFADYETFVVPQIEGWWTQPGFRVRAIGAVEVVHFARNPGATNSQAGFRIDRLHSLFTPYFSYTRRDTNANPTGFEVGYKSLRLENEFLGGAGLKITPRSELLFTGRFVRTGWDAAAIYQTSSLREKLNRDTAGASAGLAYRLTPLTRIGANVDVSTDRFRYSPIRDGDTLRLMSNLEFAKPAFIFGTASVGYEHFTSPASGAADFNGLVAAVNVGYGTPDGTLFKFYVNRDTEYSFDTALAYYVLTGLNATVARRIGRRWDSAAFVGRYMLDFRPPGTAASLLGRVDGLTEFGGAFAYRIGGATRIGWTAEHAAKSGPDGFKALRVVAFMTYGSGRFQRLDRPTPFER